MKADQSLFSGVMTDIRDNVAVGRTVTVHEKMINYKGWKGSEYIIIDPLDKYGWSDDEVGCFELGIQWGYLVTALTSIIQMFYTTKSSLEDWTNTKDCFG